MNRLFQELGGPNVELWEVPEGAHTGALRLHAEEYEQRVIAFFDRALGE